jgi:uncharacterized membrane protein
MHRLLLALPLLAAAGCATSATPWAPVRDVAYQAMGWTPMWLLAIGDDRIVLSAGEAGDRSWPRVLPRTLDGVRIWESGSGADRIVITARPGRCSGERAGMASEDAYDYEHRVTVRVGEGTELNGCGGRILRPGEPR